MNSQPANADLNRNLISFARDYARSKAPILDGMPRPVVDAVNVWLSDMMTAAELGDAHTVNAIAGRVGSKLKDELAYQLHQQRKARDRQRG
jgi:hypothetical protein